MPLLVRTARPRAIAPPLQGHKNHVFRWLQGYFCVRKIGNNCSHGVAMIGQHRVAVLLCTIVDIFDYCTADA